MTISNLIENDDVLKFFSGNKSLVSSILKSIHIYEVSELLTIDIDISLLYSHTSDIFRIRFQGVIEFSFFHNRDYYFYNIANLKFLTINNNFYISLDPDESVASMSHKDNDYILSSKLQAFQVAN